MSIHHATSTPEEIRKARIEADKLARLLSEELPDGDEIKDSLYAVSMAIKRALPAIRELEGQPTIQNQQSICTGVG